MMDVLRVILSGVAAKDPGQILRVILSEATLVAKSKDLGGPALPRRHALFCGAPLRLAARAPLTKPSLALSVGTSFRPTSRNLDSVPRVSALACNDRCRETLEEAA